MMSGRRPRPPMRRTTSMNMFSGDIARQPADQEMMDPPLDQLSNHQLQQKGQPIEPTRAAALAAEVVYRKAVEDGGDRLGWPDIGVGDWLAASHMASMLQPRGGRRRNSGDFAMLETGYFLRNCGLCKRRLETGKDIFMYRGDIAFCSLECRQQQMNLDERKEKCSLTSMKEITAASSVSEQSTNDGTVIAA